MGEPLAAQSRFEGMHPDLLLKLFLCYIQWCIDELPEHERLDLEGLTPELQAQFGCSGSRWYEVIEEAFGLPVSGRKTLADSWRDMGGEVSSQEFVSEFAGIFMRKMARPHRKVSRSMPGRRKRGH